MNTTNCYSTREVAKLYGVKIGTVGMWIYRGLLVPSQEWSGRHMISRSDLRDFENRRRQMSQKGPERASRQGSEKAKGRGNPRSRGDRRS